MRLHRFAHRGAFVGVEFAVAVFIGFFHRRAHFFRHLFRQVGQNDFAVFVRAEHPAPETAATARAGAALTVRAAREAAATAHSEAAGAARFAVRAHFFEAFAHFFRFFFLHFLRFVVRKFPVAVRVARFQERFKFGTELRDFDRAVGVRRRFDRLASRRFDRHTGRHTGRRSEIPAAKTAKTVKFARFGVVEEAVRVGVGGLDGFRNFGGQLRQLDGAVFGGRGGERFIPTRFARSLRRARETARPALPRSPRETAGAALTVRAARETALTVRPALTLRPLRPLRTFATSVRRAAFLRSRSTGSTTFGVRAAFARSRGAARTTLRAVELRREFLGRQNAVGVAVERLRALGKFRFEFLDVDLIVFAARRLNRLHSNASQRKSARARPAESRPSRSSRSRVRPVRSAFRTSGRTFGSRGSARRGGGSRSGRRSRGGRRRRRLRTTAILRGALLSVDRSRRRDAER